MRMQLKVEVPGIVPVEYGRYRNRIAHLSESMEYDASPRVVRRIRQRDGSLDPDRVEVEVFIAKDRRRAVEARQEDWLDIGPDGAWLRCKALVSKNRKSLAAFIDSGGPEWTAGDA